MPRLRWTDNQACVLRDPPNPSCASLIEETELLQNINVERAIFRKEGKNRALNERRDLGDFISVKIFNLTLVNHLKNVWRKKVALLNFRKVGKVTHRKGLKHSTRFVALRNFVWTAMEVIEDTHPPAPLYFSSRKMNMPQTRRKTYDSPEAPSPSSVRFCSVFLFLLYSERYELRTTAETSTLHTPCTYPGDSTRFTKLWKSRISLLTPPYT